MPRQTQTVRGLQLGQAEKELHKILARHATDAMLAEARMTKPGTIFEEQGRKYCVNEVYRDDLKRLVAVGRLMEEK